MLAFLLTTMCFSTATNLSSKVTFALFPPPPPLTFLSLSPPPPPAFKMLLLKLSFFLLSPTTLCRSLSRCRSRFYSRSRSHPHSQTRTLRLALRPTRPFPDSSEMRPGVRMNDGVLHAAPAPAASSARTATHRRDRCEWHSLSHAMTSRGH